MNLNGLNQRYILDPTALVMGWVEQSGVDVSFPMLKQLRGSSLFSPSNIHDHIFYITQWLGSKIIIIP